MLILARVLLIDVIYYRVKHFVFFGLPSEHCPRNKQAQEQAYRVMAGLQLPGYCLISLATKIDQMLMEHTSRRLRLG